MNWVMIFCYKTVLTIRFIFYILWEICLSNLRVSYDVISLSPKSRPGVISIPLDCETPLEISLFANIISLTPGSLTLDISADKKTLYVHSMFVDNDVDALRKELKDKFEKPILEISR